MLLCCLVFQLTPITTAKPINSWSPRLGTYLPVGHAEILHKIASVESRPEFSFKYGVLGSSFCVKCWLEYTCCLGAQLWMVLIHMAPGDYLGCLWHQFSNLVPQTDLESMQAHFSAPLEELKLGLRRVRWMRTVTEKSGYQKVFWSPVRWVSLMVGDRDYQTRQACAEKNTWEL